MLLKDYSSLCSEEAPSGTQGTKHSAKDQIRISSSVPQIRQVSESLYYLFAP